MMEVRMVVILGKGFGTPALRSVQDTASPLAFSEDRLRPKQLTAAAEAFPSALTSWAPVGPSPSPGARPLLLLVSNLICLLPVWALAWVSQRVGFSTVSTPDGQ